MLDIKLLRQSPDIVVQSLAKRGYAFPLQQFQELEQSRKNLHEQVESAQQERNKISSQLRPDPLRSEQDTLKMRERVVEIKQILEHTEKTLGDIEQKIETLLLESPNLPDDSVPLGAGEQDNVVVRTQGIIQRQEGRDHVDLLSDSRLLLLEEGVALSGSRFYVMKGALARLHRALIAFMLDYHAQAGYEEYYVPYLVNAAAALGTGQLPKLGEDMFAVHAHDRQLYLIPTAEVPLTNLFADKILQAETLPLRLMAHTPCFRSEAGSYGKDTKGIFRVHQFEKVELVHIVEPDQSEQEHELLIHQVEKLLMALELPFRISLLCTKDLGFASAKTYDFEVWLPGQQRYREISSCSNFKDFQARRMKGRYRHLSQDKPSFFHTLNGSGVAVGRALLALVENFGHPDGCDIPLALRPFLGGLSFLPWRPLA